MLIVVVGSFALYLVVANVILQTLLLRHWLNKDESKLKVDYASAWSAYPGHFVVRELSVRHQTTDANVQTWAGLPKATLEIDLWALVHRSLRITKLTAEDVTYRMRLKLESRDGNEGRVSAFPPIEGLGEPPIGHKVPKPDVPDAEYRAWTVELSDIEATLKEVWILEFRYRGAGTLTGGFHVKPHRELNVFPSVMVTHDGVYSLGDRDLIRGGDARLEVRVDPLDPRVPKGVRVMQYISFEVHQRGELVSLGSLGETYLPMSGMKLGEGTGPIAIDVRAERGVVQPESVLKYHAKSAVLEAPNLAVKGDVDFFAHVDVSHDRPSLVADVANGEVHVTPKADVHDARISIDVGNTDLAEPFALSHIKASVASANVPEIAAWQAFAPPDTRYDSGAATFAARADYRKGALEGRLDASLEKAKLTMSTTAFASSGKAWMNVASDDVEKTIAFPGTGADLHDVSIRIQDGHAEGLWARARIANAHATTAGPFGLDADIALTSGPGDKTLKLFTRLASLPDVAADATAGTRLDATGHLRVRPGDVIFDLLGAKNGALQGRGRVRKKEDKPISGAFLFSVGPLYSGLDFHDGSVSVVPLAGGAWLDDKLAKR